MARSRRRIEEPESVESVEAEFAPVGPDQGLPVFVRFLKREAPWPKGATDWLPANVAAKFVRHGVAEYAET
jgi:hypothetical protein